MPHLPNDFIERAKEFAGPGYEKFLLSLEQPAPVSIRLNPFKKNVTADSYEKIPWSENGRYLSERPSFTLDPFFHAGCYYVQDASSQFLEIPFRLASQDIGRPLKVLDLCAAPGGKSTHILSMLGEDDLLVSNEILPGRNNILRENIIKWGLSNVIITQNDSLKLSEMKDFFDVIVVDAPCSGEGLFRKDNEAIEEWSVKNVQRCAARQNEILADVYPMLRPGGYLIYSTCTFEKSENDDQVQRMISDFGMRLVRIDHGFEGIVETESGYAFFPHRIRGEGFFISMLQKESETIYSGTARIKTEKFKEDTFLDCLERPQDFFLYKKNDLLFAIQRNHKHIFDEIKDRFFVRHAGIHLGELKGSDFIPSPSLALSVHIKNNFPSVNLSKDEAISYLKGGNVPAEVPNGFALVKYEGFNLGWIKKISSRINNYYPKEWRIRMQ